MKYKNGVKETHDAITKSCSTSPTAESHTESSYETKAKSSLFKSPNRQFSELTSSKLDFYRVYYNDWVFSWIISNMDGFLLGKEEKSKNQVLNLSFVTYRLLRSLTYLALFSLGLSGDSTKLVAVKKKFPTI